MGLLLNDDNWTYREEVLHLAVEEVESTKFLGAHIKKQYIQDPEHHISDKMSTAVFALPSQDGLPKSSSFYWSTKESILTKGLFLWTAEKIKQTFFLPLRTWVPNEIITLF